MTSQPINPYQPPEADSGDVERSGASHGSLEQALAGNYDFEIGEVMGEAWELTKGFKASFWGGALIVYGVVIAVMLVSGFVSKALFGQKPGFLVSIAFNAATSLLTTPLTLGLIMLAVKRAAGAPVSFEVAFAYLNKAGSAILAALLVLLLTYAGFVLLFLPGVYLGVAYGMTMPLLADRNLRPWQALETSRRAITHKWFSVFGLYLCVGVVLVLSALPLGIGLIWTVPWSLLTIGVSYRRIFGTTEPGPAQ